MKTLFFMLLMAAYTIPISLAQTDKGANKSQIPAKAMEYVQTTYPKAKHVHYYKETEGDTIYYEIAFKFQSDKYALLFDTKGDLYETEILLPFKELPNNVQQSLEQQFNTDFDKYKIKKTETVDMQGRLLYELYVRGKKDGKTALYEYYFDRQGAFVEREQVEFQSIQTLY